MMISEREAAKRLGVLAGLTRTPARRLLRTGIAGGTPYEMERVDEVGRRRIPDDGLLRNVTTIGLLQLRLAPDQLWRTEWPAGRKLDVMREGRPTGFVRLIQLVALVRHHGPLPMIATVSGFVVGTVVRASGECTLVVEPWGLTAAVVRGSTLAGAGVVARHTSPRWSVELSLGRK
ncbi:hypothetical protein [Nocardioides sp. Kera G14]|uniref:hypothetical protein n=1 Tax=Nocardioides sp. Kera G14 TaxID=2884264 RepID=UPI001D119066|nr:hypothetical protein [Nocardioides sp. Kera G14]UDY24427.1 hypothetical protein LH076_03740 [Nocardioides sp. Kera G14]